MKSSNVNFSLQGVINSFVIVARVRPSFEISRSCTKKMERVWREKKNNDKKFK